MDDEYSAIADSHSSSSSVNKEVFAYMAGIPQEIAKSLRNKPRFSKYNKK